MKKGLILLTLVLLCACGTRNNNSTNTDSSKAIADSGRETSIAPAQAVTPTGVASADSLKKAIQGLWAAVGSENATMDINANEVSYPDNAATYKYAMKGDSITIKYTGSAGTFNVKFSNIDTLILTGEDGPQVFYRFRN